MKSYPAISRILFAMFILITFKAPAQMKKAPSLNHVAVYIYDLKKSTDFYTNIIGLTVIPEPFHDGKHTWFKIGEHSQLHLIEGAAAVIEHTKNSHLCFSVASMDDFIRLLNKNNISFESAAGASNAVTTRPDGVKQIYFKDPDGYWIEINNDTY
jgi:lactoylglutathione lyase